MTLANGDPDFSYRTNPGSVPVNDTQFNQDDANYDTLKAVHKSLVAQRNELDKWSAFTLNSDDGLTVEQQIAVNQKVFNILQPAIDAIESTLALTDEKFRERNNK